MKIIPNLHKDIVLCLLDLKRADVYEIMEVLDHPRITLVDNLAKLEKNGLRINNKWYFVKTERRKLYKNGKFTKGRPKTIYFLEVG